MSQESHGSNAMWTWLAPAAASILLFAKFAGLVDVSSGIALALSAALLGGAVFASVHHAEVLALRLGEPFGSILLALAVTVIEVALIVSIMVSGAEGSDQVARDTVFSAVMIVLNGVVGLCLIFGGQRHYEQSFRLDGASAALAVLGTLATLALVLPNYTLAISGPEYSPVQLIFIGAVSLALYLVFVFVQTIRHRDYFLDATEPELASDQAAPGKPTTSTAAASAGLLLVSLAAVVLLAKILSYPLDAAITSAGLPKTFVGVVIATVVLLPEGIASIRAALFNRLQNSINLALGSALASIGLTIPAVAVVSLITGSKLTLGLIPESIVLLVLTLFVSTLTLGTGRTTVLQGAIHLVIFATFLLLSAIP
ncbi:sodium/calcium exchanger membrane region [Methylocella silvestris BL2]|uniref:Sodium/calcium exchanger membrane region n=1 Tax=Methylocella silvestris (strain DSM 15510 / CIP 108128 / LMG 27833 / NCIMB 13906 / BL2) TaxID=395965 RepID=B8ETJ0_METSB|nr:ionic transporter y4hA [Methylocella silvestris]ACK52342.1 sodium/calcium exchanger membrane region [Methylocella silvestris BL2]